MPAGVKLTGDWDDAIATLDPKLFKVRLARALTVAGNRAGRDFQRMARGAIKARNYAPNSPISIILKGSSTPLVDKGDLFQGLTYDLAGPYELRLGVFKAKSGAQAVNIGLILHEGATVNTKTHPKVRMKVFAMLREKLGKERMAALRPQQRTVVRSAARRMGLSTMSTPQKNKVLRYLFASGKIPRSPVFGPKGSGIWVIPSRPFITAITAGSEFQAAVKKHYSEAVEAAFKVKG